MVGGEAQHRCLFLELWRKCSMFCFSKSKPGLSPLFFPLILF